MSAFVHLSLGHGQQMRSNLVCGVGAQVNQAKYRQLNKFGLSILRILCSGGTTELTRLPKGNFGRRNSLPSSARDSKQTVQVGRGSNRMRSARTTREAIDGLKNRLQQGIAIDSFTYVEVLKRSLKQEDLTAVKQVHGYVIESGMQQNVYVATNLLILYIRYGRLQDARRLFDELVRKDVISWNVMIGGYAEHSRAKDAIELFNQMRQDGVQPDAVTWAS